MHIRKSCCIFAASKHIRDNYVQEVHLKETDMATSHRTVSVAISDRHEVHCDYLWSHHIPWNWIRHHVDKR